MKALNSDWPQTLNSNTKLPEQAFSVNHDVKLLFIASNEYLIIHHQDNN